jgi:hypothetical protein
MFSLQGVILAFHFGRPGAATGAFAGEPAPTVDRISPEQPGFLWERACPRRGPKKRHKLKASPIKNANPKVGVFNLSLAA